MSDSSTCGTNACRRHPGALAVDGPAATLTFAELDDRAARVCGALAAEGIAPGARIGLLLSDPASAYPALLGVLQRGCTFVPLDPAFPPERIAYIVGDADLSAVITDAELRPALSGTAPGVRRLELVELLAAEPAPPGPPAGEAAAVCYIVYTSGTTGRPKGVAISHPSICNFVRVAAECYGITAQDRVYQGLTIAFDFAVEEIWVAWICGAALVPRPAAASLVGEELRDFLREERVSALCCVPTLLGTLEAAELEEVRFVLVSGEACPADLVARWHRPHRRLLNVYGPTEATVSASWAVLDPEQPVTIGVPLPTYALAIVDPLTERLLPPGSEGEIVIGGIGLADGYVNLPERTERSFIPDFIGLPHNPSGRLYRTGDLGRITQHGEVEHRGRIDTQVKIRGFRIETEEVEAVLREDPLVSQAIVIAARAPSGTTELVAYVVPRTSEFDRRAIAVHLRSQLPAYAVPAYLETLAELPRMPSGKIDLHRLPAPASRLGVSSDAVAARGGARDRARRHAGGAARPGAGVRAGRRVRGAWSDESAAGPMVGCTPPSADLPTPSIRDVYRARTIRALAAVLTGTRVPEDVPPFADTGAPPTAGDTRYLLCGALQLAVFLAYAVGIGAAFDAARAGSPPRPRPWRCWHAQRCVVRQPAGSGDGADRRQVADRGPVPGLAASASGASPTCASGSSRR